MYDWLNLHIKYWQGGGSVMETFGDKVGEEFVGTCVVVDVEKVTAVPSGSSRWFFDL